MGPFIELGPTEARAQQSSQIGMSQTPRVNPISSGMHHHQPPYRNKSDGNVTAEVGNNCDTTLSDFNVQVRIERTIMRDAKPRGEDTVTTAEQDLYTATKSDWDETYKSDV